MYDSLACGNSVSRKKRRRSWAADERGDGDQITASLRPAPPHRTCPHAPFHPTLPSSNRSYSIGMVVCGAIFAAAMPEVFGTVSTGSQQLQPWAAVLAGALVRNVSCVVGATPVKWGLL